MAATESQRNLDNKTNQIVGGKAVRGNDYAALQSAQQQLMAIQAEQRQNLNMARQEAQNQAAQRNILSQAGSMAAMASMPQGNPLTVNPATRAVLGRYGVGQPKTISSKNQQVTKQNVIINNNNVTNNNVTVPAGMGGPVAGRPVQINPQAAATSGLDKFKNWMNAALTKQNEDAQKRDVEYRRREWSLTRSANKMVKKIEDYAKSFGEKMDPRTIGSTWTSQVKSLLMLFGFGMLTKNWTKILLTVSKIENGIKSFINYIGVGIKDPTKKSELSKKIIYLLGGDPNNEKETVMGSFKKLFLGKEEDGEGGILGFVKKWLNTEIEDRKNAIKEVKPPTMGWGLEGNLKELGNYLGNVLGAMIGGSKSLEHTASMNMMSEGRQKSEEEALKKNSNLLQSGGVNAFEKVHTKLEDGTKVIADKGIQSWLDGESVGKVHAGLYDTSSKENIYGLGSEVNRLVGEARKGTVKTDQMAAALSDLQSAAASNRGWVPIQRNLVDGLFTTDEINQFKSREILKDSWYKLVAVKKNMLQYSTERELLAQQWNKSKAGKVLDFIGDAANIVGTAGMSEVTNTTFGGELLNGLMVSSANVYNRVTGGIDQAGRDFSNFIFPSDEQVAKGSNRGTTDYIQELRPAKPNEKGAYFMYDAKYEMIKEITKRISGKSTVSGDKSFMEGISNNLSAMATANGHVAVDTADYGQYAVADKLVNAKENKHNAEINELKNGEAGKSAERIKDTAVDAYNTVSEKASEYLNTAKEKVESYKNSNPMTQEDTWFSEGESSSSIGSNDDENESIFESIINSGKKLEQAEYDALFGQIDDKSSSLTERMQKAIHKIKEGLDISAEAASGIVGCLVAESKLKPTAINNAEKNGTAVSKGIKHLPTGYGSGIAQWTFDSRKNQILSKLKELEPENNSSKIEDYSLDSQLDALVWEIKTKRPEALRRLKSTNSVTEATDIALRGIENGSSNKLASKEQIDKYTWAGGWQGSMYSKTNGRANYAKDSLSAYNTFVAANPVLQKANEIATGEPSVTPNSIAMSSNTKETPSGSNVEVSATPVETTSSSSQPSSNNNLSNTKLDIGNQLAAADVDANKEAVNVLKGIRTELQRIGTSGKSPSAQQPLTPG